MRPYFILMLLVFTAQPQALFSVVNYIFHMPEYRPEWFGMATMMRLIELNLAFMVVGLIVNNASFDGMFYDPWQAKSIESRNYASDSSGLPH